MGKIAFIFPGQGAQYKGMGQDFFQNSKIEKEIYQKASECTGINIEEYYKEIIKNEGKEYELFPMDGLEALYNQSYPSSIDAFIYCGLHNRIYNNFF